MEKWKEFTRGRGLYILMAGALCVLGVIGAVLVQVRQENAQVEPASAQAPVVIETVPQPEVSVKPETSKPAEVKETKEVLPAPVIEKAEQLLPQVISPLDGTTVTVFSTSELLYDSTMEDWRTHAGIDIQAQEGDAVKTAAGGTVESIRCDELMGNTVVIAHEGGYTTQYSSLMEAPPVSVGQKLTAGDVIGYVGTSAAAELEMGPHLHFSVSKDGKVIDPGDYVR